MNQFNINEEAMNIIYSSTQWERLGARDRKLRWFIKILSSDLFISGRVSILSLLKGSLSLYIFVRLFFFFGWFHLPRKHTYTLQAQIALIKVYLKLIEY